MLPRKTIGWLVAPILALLVFALPLPLEKPAHQVAAIMAFCLVFWITEALPLSVTALLGVSVAVFLGLTSIDTAFTSMGHPIILLFLGSFLLAQSMTRHGLDRRMALLILAVPFFQKSLFRLFLGFSMVAFVLSMWVSNSVTVAMLLPLMLGIIALVQSPDDKQNRMPAYMLLGIAYSASIGGLGTIIGSPPNLIGVKYLEQAGLKIDFLQWMLLVLPVALVMYGFMLFYVKFHLKNCPYNPERIKAYITENTQELRPVSAGERNTFMVFMLAVTLWLLPGLLNLAGFEAASTQIGKLFPESLVALLAAIFLFLLPADKKLNGTLLAEDLRNIDWDTILLFAGGLALGSLIISTGLASFLGDLIAGSVSPDNTALLIFTMILGIMVLTEISSNTAIAITFIPIVIDILSQLNLPVLYPVLGVVMASSLAFMLPIATPPNAIVFGSGYVPITKMIKTGVWMNLIGTLLLFTYVMLMLRLIG